MVLTCPLNRWRVAVRKLAWLVCPPFRIIVCFSKAPAPETTPRLNLVLVEAFRFWCGKFPKVTNGRLTDTRGSLPSTTRKNSAFPSGSIPAVQSGSPAWRILWTSVVLLVPLLSTTSVFSRRDTSGSDLTPDPLILRLWKANKNKPWDCSQGFSLRCRSCSPSL